MSETYTYTPKQGENRTIFAASCIESVAAALQQPAADVYQRIGTATAEYALSELSKHQPNHQICILNQQALDECLYFKESIVC